MKQSIYSFCKKKKQQAEGKIVNLFVDLSKKKTRNIVSIRIRLQTRSEGCADGIRFCNKKNSLYKEIKKKKVNTKNKVVGLFLGLLFSFLFEEKSYNLN